MKHPFSYRLAPRAGLEPATSRLQGFPIFREGLDYLFTRLCNRRGCRALVRRYWVGSSASSLCTFLPTHMPFGRLRSGFPYRLSAG